MTGSAKSGSPDEPNGPERFRQLPERIRLEDTITTQETDPPPDPSMGRDTEQDFVLRYAGG